MAFDSLGVRRQRIDDEFALENARTTPFFESLRDCLKAEPAAFSWGVELKGMAPVKLAWSSVFEGVGTAMIRMGNEPASSCIYLSGRRLGSEISVIEAMAAGMASKPGGTFRPAYVAFLDARERPLIAAIRFPGVAD